MERTIEQNEMDFVAEQQYLSWLEDHKAMEEQEQEYEEWLASVGAGHSQTQ